MKKRFKPKIKEIRNPKGEIIGLEITEWMTIAEVKKHFPDYKFEGPHPHIPYE